MKDQIREIVTDPAWLIDRYDAVQDCFHLRRVTRADHDRVTFLTDKYLPKVATPLVLKRDDVMAAFAHRTPAPLHFIFHSAFCCSTLLARAFDHPGMAMGLKEPMIFNDLIGWRQRGATPSAWAAVQRDVLVAVAKPFDDGEAVVVKPSSITNSLASSILDALPDARAILMYAPLETFLTSVAKKGMDGRLWARTLFAGFMRDGVTDLGYDREALFGQTDLQIAALGWLVQHRMFQKLLAGQAAQRIRSLRSDHLLDAPTRVFKDAAIFFGLSGAADLAPGSGDEKVFHQHSKTGARFDTIDRAREYREATERHGEEIEKVMVWARHVADHNRIALDLSQSL